MLRVRVQFRRAVLRVRALSSAGRRDTSFEFMAKFFRGDKRRREMDRKRRSEEKQRRLQFRREMRARGLDPDTVDADGKPLPGREGEAAEGASAEGAAESKDEAEGK